MKKRKFNLSRFYNLVKGLFLLTALMISAVTTTKIVKYYLNKCPQTISNYFISKKNFEDTAGAFCKKYDFKGKWGDSTKDWEGKFHFKGDYKLEDCIAAYEKQETLEAVPYYGDPPQGITEKIWNPPNFRGMMGVRIVGEPRKAVTASDYPFMCEDLDPKLNIKWLVLGFSPLVILIVIKNMILYVFPKSS